MNVLQTQFVEISVKIELVRVEVGGKKKEGGAIEGEVCYSVTHNEQFNAKYHMIS